MRYLLISLFISGLAQAAVISAPATSNTVTTIGAAGSTVYAASTTVLTGATFYASGIDVQLATTSFSGPISFTSGHGIVGNTLGVSAPSKNYGFFTSSSCAVNPAGTTSQYYDLASLTLGAGTYLIIVTGSYDRNGATIGATAACQLGFSTTAGNNSTGLTLGTSLQACEANSVIGSGGTTALGTVTPSGSTTYYLKSRIEFSAATPTWSATISALRIY